jgi:UDP-3-O-[3-hydroxymyristoyl] N-acetylglucosamine deacetylase/3-hydroxyacyl-[acyl-carrier-protein] dehydratase
MDNSIAVKQKTLNKAFSLEGKGLHTGLNICITFSPAPENYGYKIRRTDLPNQPIIIAGVENVINTDRGTVLSENGVHVGTVEHGLAALYACEIDNCLIEVDAPEFPILDGSSIDFVNKIKQTGIREQSAERIYYMPENKIEYRNEASGSHLMLLPSDSFEIHTQISFDSEVLTVQSAYLKDLSEFPTEIAMCRTFVFVKEIEALLQKGLIKGGDLDNTIVIYDKPVPQKQLDKLADLMKVERKDAENLGYLMNVPLRFSNEPARHKILDILGDIALTGKFIKGTIVSVCPGHQANSRFAQAILNDIRSKN